MLAVFVYASKGGTVAHLSPLYIGPYKVLSSGPKVFKLQVGERVEVISIDCLKPHRGTIPVQPAQPPARGEPPAADPLLILTLGPQIGRGTVAEQN
jgi:hypothetical protein